VLCNAALARLAMAACAPTAALARLAIAACATSPPSEAVAQRAARVRLCVLGAEWLSCVARVSHYLQLTAYRDFNAY
jgi:hypothetical protein